MKASDICIWLVLFAATRTFAADPKFAQQTIDDQIEIGYGLTIGKMDADSHLDILLADKSEIAWYKNPGVAKAAWKKHVIARNLTQRDNVCVAARDFEGDGMMEVAVGADWNPGETNDASASGALFYLERPADPTMPWKPIPITPHQPTTHRMHWVDTPQGLRLAVLPLHGVGNKDGAGETVEISIFELQDDGPKLVGRVDTGMHATHNFELFSDPDLGEHEAMLVAGKEGFAVAMPDPGGSAFSLVDDSISKGGGEVRRYPNGKRAFVAIEPMHGTDVVLYQSAGQGEWNKEVIDTTLNAGHALAAGNIMGDETPEVIAGWRSRDQDGKIGIKVYERVGGTWKSHLLDDNQTACEDLKLVDLNGDGKLDIIAAGRATKNVVVYWNENW